MKIEVNLVAVLEEKKEEATKPPEIESKNVLDEETNQWILVAQPE